MNRPCGLRPIAALLTFAALACAPATARALDDPIWAIGGGFGYTPAAQEGFEFSGEAVALRAGAGARVHGPLRAALEIEHLFFQVPRGRMAVATISSLDEDRSQLTTAMLGLEIATQTWNRSGPFVQVSAGAARVAFGEIRGVELNDGPFTIDGGIELQPAFGAGVGFRARPSTGLGPGLQGAVRLVHVPADRGDLRVVTTSIEVLF